MKKVKQSESQFGKKNDNNYQIIERKYKDGNTRFYVQIDEFTSNCVTIGIDIPYTYIFDGEFKTYDDAMNCIKKLKEEDKKLTVLEEKIHKV